MALDFVVVKYSSISSSYYWILCGICVLYSTLQSLLIRKIIILKVLLPLTPAAFPMQNALFYLSSVFLLIWHILWKGWRFIIYKEGYKWQKAVCHLDLTNPVALLLPSTVQNSVQNMKKVEVWSLRCDNRLRINTELLEICWVGLDLLSSVSCSSAFLSQCIDGHEVAGGFCSMVWATCVFIT